LSACGILSFGQKACISAVALPRLLAKPWSPLVPKNPGCAGLPMAWMRSSLCALPFSTSRMTRSGIHLDHFWLLDCLQLFHTPMRTFADSVAQTDAGHAVEAHQTAHEPLDKRSLHLHWTVTGKSFSRLFIST